MWLDKRALIDCNKFEIIFTLKIVYCVHEVNYEIVCKLQWRKFAMLAWQSFRVAAGAFDGTFPWWMYFLHFNLNHRICIIFHVENSFINGKRYNAAECDNGRYTYKWSASIGIVFTSWQNQKQTIQVLIRRIIYAWYQMKLESHK